MTRSRSSTPTHSPRPGCMICRYRTFPDGEGSWQVRDVAILGSTSVRSDTCSRSLGLSSPSPTVPVQCMSSF